MPEGFPPMTLAAQRALCAISLKALDSLVPAVDVFYRSMWVDGNAKMGQPEGFMPVLENLLGKDKAQEILAAVCLPHGTDDPRS
jgi:2-hydroxychromene-2-carboxylate isomerase